MKVYKIKVNGKVYEVEVELLENQGTVESKTSNNDIKQVNNSSGEVVNAPMQGNILAIKKKIGDKVFKGDILIILEAMKMENEILSPIDGIIENILVQEGRMVNSGEGLISIK